MTNSFFITDQVFKSIRYKDVRDFMKSKGIDVEERIRSLGINKDNNYEYPQLLNSLLRTGAVSKDEAISFLVDQTRYGQLRNIYIDFLSFDTDLSNEDVLTSKLRNLSNIDEEFGKLNQPEKIGPINTNIQENSELVYLNVERNNGIIKKIYITLRKKLSNNSHEWADHYSFEVDLSKRMLVSKARNWDQKTDNSYDLKGNLNNFKDQIISALDLKTIQTNTDIQRLMLNILNDITLKVLQPTMDDVDEKLREDATLKVREWLGEIVDDPDSYPSQEVSNIIDNVLNNFYQVDRLMTSGVEKVSELNEKYGVCAYPRVVRFLDESIGEARAKSSDSKESLLETGLYFDIRTRLGSSKSLKYITVYWLTCSNSKHFGVTIHNDVRSELRMNFLPHTYDKEMLEYVLQKIEDYT